MIKAIIIAVLIAVVSISGTLCHPMCMDTSGPEPSPQLTFCAAYKNSSCCYSGDDSIKNDFTALSPTLVNDVPECAAAMKAVLCAKCDPYSAHLFGVEDLTPRTLPALSESFCTQLYTACQNVPLNGASNPFTTLPSIGAAYPTRDQFCATYSLDYGGYSFSGVPYQTVVPNHTIDEVSQICTKKLNDGMYLSLVSPPNDTSRLFAVEKAGAIKIIDTKTQQVTGTFLDISSRVNTDSENGLLGLAFHPNYTHNGLFYIYYACNKETCPITCKTVADCDNTGNCNTGVCTLRTIPGQPVAQFNVLAEYKVSSNDSDRADPVATRTLLKFPHPFQNHNGGFLAFSKMDKMLYLSTGDGGLAGDIEGNAQALGNLMGKILRIDVTSEPDEGLNYSIPRDNPFYGKNNTRGEIWAYGLRNPWRCSFDKLHPALLICGDVGQDAIEEVDIITRGANYGWRKHEGNRIFSATDPDVNYTKPILEYNHTIGKAVIGGYFYRGARDPCQCGKYIFGDWEFGVYFEAFENPIGSGMYDFGSLAVKCAGTGCVTAGQMYTFAEDLDGDLYMSTLRGTFVLDNPAACGISCPCDCVIDGNCFKANVTNPANPCLVCKRETPCEWTTIADCEDSTSTGTTKGPATTTSGKTDRDTSIVSTTMQAEPSTATFRQVSTLLVMLASVAVM